MFKRTGKWWRASLIAIILGMPSTDLLAQSMSGLSIGDNISTTENLGFEPAQVNRNGPFLIAKWHLPDGNELSITSTSEGTIVFMEHDWMGGVSGRFTDFSGLVFGKTSLKDIRKITGSNGFCYTATGCVANNASEIVNFNSWQIDGADHIILTLITNSSFDRAGDPSSAMLSAIILAYEPYLKGIWGEEKLFDPKYQPIKMK